MRPKVFMLREPTPERLASELQAKLKAGTIRVVGDSKLPIGRLQAGGT
jgi:hypothetical protein